MNVTNFHPFERKKECHRRFDLVESIWCSLHSFDYRVSIRSGTDSIAKVSNIRISKEKIRVENHLLPFFEESELCLLLAL